MKHTAGPWTVSENKLQCFIDGPEGEEVAQCLGSANGRLIAAAPELLAALKQIERSGCDDFERVQLRELIAKAEGK